MPRWAPDYVPVAYQLDTHLLNLLRERFDRVETPLVSISALQHGYRRVNRNRTIQYAFQLEDAGRIVLHQSGTPQPTGAALPDQVTISTVVTERLQETWHIRRFKMEGPTAEYPPVQARIRVLIREHVEHLVATDAAATLEAAAVAATGFHPHHGPPLAPGALQALAEDYTRHTCLEAVTATVRLLTHVDQRGTNPADLLGAVGVGFAQVNA